MIFGFNEPNVPSVEPESVKHAIDTHEEYVILDVRTPGEFSRGKVPGSVNLSVDRVGVEVASVLPDRKRKIYVYCLSGARSAVAVEEMMKLGYTNVCNMSHGILGWRAKYFPMES